MASARRLRVIGRVLLAGVCVALARTRGGESLQTLEGLVTQLVALQEARYAAEAEWKEQRPAVEARRKVLENERDAAAAALENAREAVRATDSQRAAAEQSRDVVKARVLALGAPVQKAEDRLRALTVRLPEPLLSSLGDRLAELPPAGSAVTVDNLGDRLRLVFGLLTEIEQFSHAMHLIRQRLEGAEGGAREMDVLYLGTSIAFAVSPGGDVAATGRPGPTGWTWRWDPGIADQVRAAVAVFRKERPAGFVTLPMALTSVNRGAAE